MKNIKMSSFKKVLKEIGQYKFLLLLSIVLSLITVLLTLYIPVLFGDAIDYIPSSLTTGNSIDFNELKVFLEKIALLIVLTSILTWIMNVINNKVAYGVVKNIRAKAIRQIQVLPLSYIDRQSAGDIVQRMIGDVDQLSDGLLLV